MCGIKGRRFIVLFKQHPIRCLWNVRMIVSLPTKRISAISQWKTFIIVLPTRWRRKPTGIEITSLSRYVYGDGWPSSGGYTLSVCNQPTRSTQPFGVAKSSSLPALLGANATLTSAGWQVTPCDPIWHESSRSGEASCNNLQTAMCTPFTLTWSTLLALCLPVSVTVIYTINISDTVTLGGAYDGDAAFPVGLISHVIWCSGR